MPTPLDPGDRVRFVYGTFEGYDGEVQSIDEPTGNVTVMLTVFGRRTPVEIDHRLLKRL